MAVLPVNYVDAVWSGNREYSLTQNPNSTVSLTDVTEYSVEGSQFGAGDINATNRQVNGISGAKTITIAASAWGSSPVVVSGGSYYTATITGLTIYTENPQIGIYPAGTIPTETEEANFAAIAYAVADVANGSITFYAYSKPEATINVLAKGVS